MYKLNSKDSARILSALKILLFVGIIFLVVVIFYKPVIDSIYPSKSKTHDVKTIKEGKVRIVQYGDALKGAKDSDSKVVIHIFPERKKRVLTVNEQGEWILSIDSSLFEGNHTFLITYLDQQDVIEQTRIHKIKIVPNREFYKEQKKLLNKTSSVSDKEKEEHEGDARKACQKYEFFICGSCNEELYVCLDGTNVVKIQNPQGQCGTTSWACGRSSIPLSK